MIAQSISSHTGLLGQCVLIRDGIPVFSTHCARKSQLLRKWRAASESIISVRSRRRDTRTFERGCQSKWIPRGLSGKGRIFVTIAVVCRLTNRYTKRIMVS